MKSVQYRFGPFRLVSATRQIWRNDQPLELPRLVFDCVLYLLENRDRAIGRDELVAALWGRVDVADTQLSQLMRRVRHALGDDGQSQKAIRTVQGYGYRWAMPAKTMPMVPNAEPTDGSGATSALNNEAEISATTTSAPELPPQSVRVGANHVRKRRPSRWRAWGLCSLAAITIAGGLFFATALLHDGPTPATANVAPNASRAIVLPLDVSAASDSAWVRLGAMDIVADRLRASGLAVPPSESVVAAVQSASGARTPTHLEDLFSAGIVIRGNAVKSAAGWQVSLQAQSPGDLQRTAEASDREPVPAIQAAADRLVAALGRAPAPDTHETDPLGARIARIRAALLANEIALARQLLAADEGSAEDTTTLRYWRAQTDFRAGDFERAQAGFEALLDDPRVLADTHLHGRVLIARAGNHIRRAEYAEAEADFNSAVRVIKDFNESSEYAEALAGRGIARVALRHFDGAAADFGQARLQMERAGDAFGATRVDANLGLFELVRRRPANALPYLRSAVIRFEAFGAVSALLSTLNAQFDAHAFLLQWSDALAVSERRWALRGRAADPMQRYLIGVDRSRVLAAFGRYREAHRALDAVEEEYPDMRKPIVQVLHAQRADLAWREGHSTQALARAQEGLDDAPCTDASAPCETLALIYQRALIVEGQADAQGIPPADQVLHTQGTDGPPSLAVARAEWSAHSGRPDDAETGFRAALADVEDEGTPSDVALVVSSYAHWLIEQRRLDDAAAVAGRVAPWADRDFDCALLQVAVMHAYGRQAPWATALQRARLLAGERAIPSTLLVPPG